MKPHEYLLKHSQEWSEKYPGKYIAIIGDKLVAIDDTELEVFIMARENYPDLLILTGCEAKIVEDGSLDVSEEILKQSEIVLMAFHSFPRDKEEYIAALETALSNARVDIWAHPGLFLRTTNLYLREHEIEDILDIASHNNVLLELNEKYCLPPRSWVEIGGKKGVKFVRGGDIHSVEELK
jgi:histidinol phosphatase-like PHP family hydrolase